MIKVKSTETDLQQNIILLLTDALLFFFTSSLTVTHSFEDDDEEGKDISRTQSMDNLAIMQKMNPRPIL